MKASIIKIGNSRGIRIPKTLLSQTGLSGTVQLKVKDNSIVISPAEELTGRELAILSESSLSDWNSPEEDEAWDYLQSAI